MNRKLGIALGITAFVLVGAGVGGHLVIKRSIDKEIERIVARSPGTTITYGGYFVDPLTFDIGLRDVVFTQNMPKTADGLPATVTMSAERVVYDSCDFENPVPRSCKGSMFGVKIGSETADWKELTTKVESWVGKPMIMDVVSDSTYDPKGDRPFSTQAKITYRDFGSFDFALSGDGIDMDAFVEKLRAALPTLETGGEEARTAFAIGMMGDVSNLRIRGVSIEASGDAALDKLLNSVFSGVTGEEGAAFANAPARLTKFDEVVAKLKDGPTTQPAATFLSDPAMRSFIEAPKSLAFVVAPETPVTVMSFGMKVMGGLTALNELKLKIVANGKDLSLEPLITASAANAALMQGSDPGDLPTPEELEEFEGGGDALQPVPPDGSLEAGGAEAEDAVEGTSESPDSMP
jgi:hypothetical protein